MKSNDKNYNELLQILKLRWKNRANIYSELIGINPAKASRILNGKQEAPFDLLKDMAAIVNIKVEINYSEMYV